LKKIYAISKPVISEAQNKGIIQHGDPGRIYHAIISLAGSHFIFSDEYSRVTGDTFDLELEKERTLELINRLVFINPE